MNLYLLEREAPPDRPKAFVVAARDALAARRIAARSADGERGAWLDDRTSACSLIGVTIPGDRARSGVVVRELARDPRNPRG